MRFKKDVKTCLLYGLIILLTFVNIKSMFLITILFAGLLVWQIYLTNKHMEQDAAAEERRRELGIPDKRAFTGKKTRKQKREDDALRKQQYEEYLESVEEEYADFDVDDYGEEDEDDYGEWED